MSAVICSCNNVTKGDICSAIDGGVKDLPGLKAAPSWPPVAAAARRWPAPSSSASWKSAAWK
jgi:hypothetical protein